MQFNRKFARIDFQFLYNCFEINRYLLFQYQVYDADSAMVSRVQKDSYYAIILIGAL